ncbi:MAG: (d)CMP kinase [Coriobacteriia bacterium]
MIIAIDGPAGSGKSTVAKSVAERLGMRFLDTGAMYRSVAARGRELGIDDFDDAALARIASAERISFTFDESGQRVFIGGKDVTRAIRTPEIDGAVSAVASLPGVRAAMVAQQRQIANTGDFVVEGRDIGTVVFPDADVKVYLTASAEERARRRTAQHETLGMAVEPEDVQEALERRDEFDSSREHSPLTAAADAVILDTTDLSLEQVIKRVLELAKGRRR